jgi:predicted GNAT family acetyltransferase
VEIVQLTPRDREEILDLKARAFPGFFGPRAPELGSFFGVRLAKTGMLVAMAGERLATFAEREISAVCTDPAFTGRGYAARAIRAVLRHQASLGCGSILHVAAENQRAISLYEYLGFRITGPIDFIKLQRL